MTSVEALEATLRQAGEEHHQAFQSTDGYDPDWGHWYARYVFEHDSVPAMTQEELAARLFELAENDPGTEPWSEYYARSLLST